MFKVKYLIFLLLGLVPFIFLTQIKSVEAARLIETPFVIPEEEIINDDVYIILTDEESDNQTVEVNGTINGDLVVSAGNVVINGIINGNLYVVSGVVEISGEVYKSAYILSGNVSMNGKIREDLFVTAGSFNQTGVVQEDVLAVVGQTKIEGNIGDDLRAVTGNITVSSEIGGDLIAITGNAATGSAVVKGETIIKTDTGEETSSFQIPEINTETLKPRITASTIIMSFLNKLITYIGLFVLGLVLFYIFPVKTDKYIVNTINSTNDFLFSLAYGFAGLILLPILSVILMITVIGAPLGFVILGAYIFLISFAQLWIHLAIGKKLLSYVHLERSTAVSFGLGLLISFIISWIPIVGAFYALVITCTGIGSILRTKKHQLYPRYIAKAEVKSKK